MEFIVLLADQTTGRLLSNVQPTIGSIVTILTHDDDGYPMEVNGDLVEIVSVGEAHTHHGTDCRTTDYATEADARTALANIRLWGFINLKEVLTEADMWVK